jgi:cytochrome c556
MSRLLAAIALSLLIGSLFGACTPMQRNPDRQACIRRCTETKNSCMLNASNPDQVGACDAEFGKCTDPCRQLPEYVPAG